MKLSTLNVALVAIALLASQAIALPITEGAVDQVDAAVSSPLSVGSLVVSAGLTLLLPLLLLSSTLCRPTHAPLLPLKRSETLRLPALSRASILASLHLPIARL